MTISWPQSPFFHNDDNNDNNDNEDNDENNDDENDKNNDIDDNSPEKKLKNVLAISLECRVCRCWFDVI